jgi:hypothetical protein
LTLRPHAAAVARQAQTQKQRRPNRLEKIVDFWRNLSPTDRINLFVAIGTGLAAVGAAVSTWFAARALRETLRQMEFQRAEFRAQTFLGVLEYEREVHFSQHMDVVRGLGGKSADKLTIEERASILVVVVFLNHIAHLIRHRYVVPKQVLLLYSPSIAACRENLLGEHQWLKTMRRDTGEGRYYLHFARLCQEETEDLIWRGQADKIAWTTDPYEPPTVL